MSKLRNASAILCLAVLCSLVYFANAWGQEIRHIRVLETDDVFDVVNPDGVVFPPRAHSLLVLDQPIPGAATITLFQKGGPHTLSLEISDPINVTFDGRANRLFLFEPEPSELVVIKLRGQFKTDVFMADEYSVANPSGIAVDPKHGTLFILDRVGPKIVQVDPGPNRKRYDGAAALEEGRISVLPLQRQGRKLRGLGFNHADRCLYVFSDNRQELYRITEDGELVRVGDFSGFARIDLKGLVFVRSLDQTDDPKQRNLYIASSGGPSQVSEWSVTPCVQGSAQ